jgi:hypothetical protein
MIKNKLSVYFIFISIFTAITGFALVVQKSYSNLIGPSQNIDTSKLLKPITPIIDSSIIQEIQNRPDSDDDQQLNIIEDVQPTTTPEKINNPQNEASIEATPTITE